jgi:hypothetical protein
MSQPIAEHLNWLALQYVLGELSESDRSTFELRLADDLQACEAVVAATRLAMTLQAATSIVAPAAVMPVRSKSLTGAWLAIGMTSAAMALSCLLVFRTPTPATPSSAAQLVSLWHAEADAGDEDSDDGDDLMDAAGDVAVPGWMLAAVSLESPRSDEPADDVKEN